MAEYRRSSVEALTPCPIAFEEYRFDPGTGELWRGDKEIKLTPRAAALLAVLAERALQVVTKQELVARSSEFEVRLDARVLIWSQYNPIVVA